MDTSLEYSNTNTLPQKEKDGITHAIIDYMEPWYGLGHASKLVHAIHPTIIKRKFYQVASTGVSVLRQVTAHQLIELAKDTTVHPRNPNTKGRCDIVIYDVFHNIATAKAIGSTWSDYIHLAKLDDRWQIMHILFENPRENVPSANNDAIRKTLLDYMESWYTNEYKRLEKSFYPAVVKRGFYPLSGGQVCISITTISEMVERMKGAWLRRNQSHSTHRGRVEVEILDTYQQIATAKTVGDGWIDYLHLAEVNGEWKIINILYDRPSNYN
jgi:hypothetical protein